MPRSEISNYQVITSCAALFVLAVAQPILGLLGGSPEFFVASDATAADLVGLALGMAVALPLAVGLVVVAVRSVSDTAGLLLHAVVLTALAGVLAVVVMGHTPLASLPGGVQIALALALGAAATLAYHRYEAVRSLLAFGSVAVLVAPALFLFASPTSRLVFGSEAVAVAGVVVADPPPVVMVLFDELPLASLIDGEGRIQAGLYPHFARLAEDATWYRNAVTTHWMTRYALPAALTGTTPGRATVPTAFDHPHSLFTLLGGVYQVEAVEPISALCPPQVCERSADEAMSRRQRWAAMADDLRIVAAHALLPRPLTGDLPPIDEAWAGFGRVPVSAIEPVSGYGAVRERVMAEIGSDRSANFDAFLGAIQGGGESPALHFAHVMLPHSGWEYLPNGQRYLPPVPQLAGKGPVWLSDPWTVSQSYQRHLLQVQFVDTVVGRLIERLVDVGIYEESLLVVAADHGIAFRTDLEHRRAADATTMGDIAPVPLFIKLPHQRSGGIDDYRALITDILPTIADALGIALPWPVEGTSLIAPGRPRRESSVIVTRSEPAELSFGTTGEEKLAAAARRLEIFRGGGPFDLAPQGAGDLLGTTVADYPSGTASVEAVLSDGGLPAQVDLEADFLPLVVQGALRHVGEPTGNNIVAVAVNGVIVAVTRSQLSPEGRDRYHALLPPHALASNGNRLDLLLVEGEPGNRILTRIGPVTP